MGVQMTAETVVGGRAWFERFLQELHIGPFGRSSPFSTVARWTGGDNIGPKMLAAHTTGDNMVDGQQARFLGAILASIIVSPQHFPFGQIDRQTGALDHVAKLYN